MESHRYRKEFILLIHSFVLTYNDVLLCVEQCLHPNPSHSEGFCTAVPAAYGIPVQRSISGRDGAYPIEVEFVFAEIASTSQPIRTSFLTMLASVWSSVSVLTFTIVSCVVELGKAETASTSRSRPQNASRSLRRSAPVFRF